MASGMGQNLFAPGDSCGNHEVVRLIGAGGFAQVYEVVDSHGARRALKIIAASPGVEPKLHARLAQEGAALSMIEHVNVVRLYGAGLHGAHVWLLLELIQGKNLREMVGLDRGGTAVETVVRWARQACDGVAEAHRVGVVHRDLKPENILVTPSDLVKVIDFGIAKFAAWGVKTTHEQRVGTALYMSPEQVHGRPPDPRMDVYGMGIILYEALAHVHPIAPKPASVFDVCVRQLVFRPEPLAKVAPHVPPDLAAIVDRAIQKDPNARLPSMGAMSAALHEALLRLTAQRRADVAHLLPSSAGLPDGLPSVGPLAMTQPKLFGLHDGAEVRPLLPDPPTQDREFSAADLRPAHALADRTCDTPGLVRVAAGEVRAAPSRNDVGVLAMNERSSPRLANAVQRWHPSRALLAAISVATAVASWCIFEASEWPERSHSVEATALATAREPLSSPMVTRVLAPAPSAHPHAPGVDPLAPTASIGLPTPFSPRPPRRARSPAAEHSSGREQPFPVPDDEPTPR